MVVSHSADGTHFYMVRFHSHSLQLLAVALLEVDVPFCLPFGYGVHVKSCLGKLLIYLLPHLKVFERYSRPNHAMHILRLRMICDSHRLDCLLYYSRHRASPSGMHCCHGIMLRVVYNNRYAVGCGYTDTDAAHVGHHGIHTFEYHPADILGQTHKVLGNLPHCRAMSLVWHHEMSLVNTQFFTQQPTIGGNVINIVATIFIDIEG